MKIDREKMLQIDCAIQARNELREKIRTNFSNEALAARMGVNVRTIEKHAALCQPAKVKP